VKRTFVDAGVLIAAASGRSPDVQSAALKIIDDPEREFVSSRFLRLEVLPKAVHYRKQAEIDFYEVFFAGVVSWAEPLADVVLAAEREAIAAGLALPDALHFAAAVMLGADDFVTTERPGRAIFRVSSLPVWTIYPAAPATS
jgi:predicted nucleic acid-binding protein